MAQQVSLLKRCVPRTGEPFAAAGKGAGGGGKCPAALWPDLDLLSPGFGDGAAAAGASSLSTWLPLRP